MTSAILAQKLIQTKLDKGELEKIKWMRYSNMEMKRKATEKLKDIVDKQVLNTCRLCLRPGGVRVFSPKLDIDLASDIKHILGVEIRKDDGKPQHVCQTCANVIRKAIELKQTAETTQWRLQQELEMVAELSSDWEPENTNIHGGYFVEKESKIIRQWSCAKCKSTFQTKEKFTEHEKMENCQKEKCFVCELCGMELKTVTRLNRHRLTHSSTLNHQCPSCPYRARTPHALRVHARGHSGARPARCALCHKTFPSSSNLASHRRSHAPPGYHCQMCQKGFKFKEALLNHMATQHSNAKPFNCIACGKAFSTRKMIRRHERKVHNRPKMRSGVVPSYIRLQQELQT